MSCSPTEGPRLFPGTRLPGTRSRWWATHNAHKRAQLRVAGESETRGEKRRETRERANVERGRVVRRRRRRASGRLVRVAFPARFLVRGTDYQMASPIRVRRR